MLVKRFFLIIATIVVPLMMGSAFAELIELDVSETREYTLKDTAERINIETSGVVDVFLPQSQTLSITGLKSGVTVLNIKYADDDLDVENLEIVVSSEKITTLEVIAKDLRQQLASLKYVAAKVETLDDGERKVILSGKADPVNEGYIGRVTELFSDSIVDRIAYIDLQKASDLAKKLKKIFADIPGLDISVQNENVILSGRDIDGQYKDFYKKVIMPFQSEVTDQVMFLKLEKPEVEEKKDAKDEKLLAEEAKRMELTLPTIQIDIEMVEISLEKTRDLGAKWFDGHFLDIASELVGTIPKPTNPINTITGTVNYQVGDIDNFKIQLKALIGEGCARVLARPKLRVRSGNNASFVVGGEVPIVQVTATSSTVEYKDFGTQLLITPEVGPDGIIDVKVNTTISELDFSSTVQGYPMITKKEAETQLSVNDGETFALAGLIERKVSRTMTGLPGLHKIPVLGFFFRFKSEEQSDYETVVLMTPHILKKGEGIEGTGSEPWMGTSRARSAGTELKCGEISTQYVESVTQLQSN